MAGEVMRLGPLQAESWGDPEGFVTFGIPGLSANLRAFDVIAAAVAGPGRRFVSLDLRGRGLSEVTPPGSYGWESHARDVVAAFATGADVTGAVRCGRPVDGDHGVGRIDVRVPARDGSVFGREQEEAGPGGTVLRDHEVRRVRVEGVECLPGRRSHGVDPG